MILFWLLGCQNTEKDTASITTITYICEEPFEFADWTQGFLDGKCQPCHGYYSPNRYGAPDNVWFDTEEASVFWKEAIRRTVLETETMPPSGGVNDDEKALLTRWLNCIEG